MHKGPADRTKYSRITKPEVFTNSNNSLIDS